MKTIILSNGELKEKEINNTLQELQNIVGGYIEMPLISKVFFENEIDIIINEEGKYIDGLNPEIAIIKKGTDTILDIVYGNCIFASHDSNGNTVGLNDKQTNIINKELKTSVVLHNSKTNKDILIKTLFI